MILLILLQSILTIFSSNMKKYLITASILTLSLTACAKHHHDCEHHQRGEHAGFFQHFHEKMMQELDTNHDSKVSKKEWMKFSEAKFNEIDANHDGQITEEEFAANREKMREKFKEHHHDHGDHDAK